MSNFLNNKKAYLSGPIEYDHESLNWRTEPVKILTEKFGIDVFDPFADPKQQWAEKLKEAKITKDFETISNVAHAFVRKDLHQVDLSHLLIAYIPHKTPTTGTVHEIINSNNSKKPTLLVSNTGDISNIPAWYFGFIPIEFIFPNWNSLYEYLEKVNDPEQKVHDRWKFIQGKI